jgi:hypothetical protein
VRIALALSLSGALVFAGGPAAHAQTPVTDADVQKGIRMVDDGDYDAAILLLDAAARRLSGDAGKVRDLSQAYLYLGIAYVGKGHEAAAKAKFREAVTRIKDLSLSPDKYPPKVIDLFEAAREEARTAGARPPASAAASGPPARSEGGGGGKKLLLIGGLGLAAAGGAVFALKGGEDQGCDTVFMDPSGILNNSQTQFEFTTGPAIESGSWKAEVNWRVTSSSSRSPTIQSSRSSALPLTVKLEVFQGGQKVADSRLLSDTASIAEWSGAPGTSFTVRGSMQGGAGGLSYDLLIEGPCVN